MLHRLTNGILSRWPFTSYDTGFSLARMDLPPWWCGIIWWSWRFFGRCHTCGHSLSPKHPSSSRFPDTCFDCVDRKLAIESMRREMEKKYGVKVDW